MSLTTRDRKDELQALEELWTAPAFGEPGALPATGRRRLPRIPGVLLAGGWFAFFAIALTFEPTPDHELAIPVWATTVSVVMLLLIATLRGFPVNYRDLTALDAGPPPARTRAPS